MWRTAVGVAVTGLIAAIAHATLPMLVLACTLGAVILVFAAVVLMSVLGTDKRREAALATLRTLLGRPSQ